MSTTIVYKEEMITSKSPNSGTPRNVQTKTFTVQIMGDGQSSSSRGGPAAGGGGSSNPHTPRHSRGGSPKPNKKFSVKKGGKQSPYVSYNPHIFTITAYLPYEGGKRLKLQCRPGQSVQQVIESEIPNLSQTGYQVYQFPSRALLNPEKDASVLQDQEITIEPMRAASPDEISDDRLAIVKELLRSEDTYLENLKNIFDIYMEPLKKWGLPQSDMNVLFRALSRLCDILMNFFSKLELSVQRWNTNTTLIGGLFKQHPSFWEMYHEYSQNYGKACKLLKDKRALDESFNRFLEMKRGAAMHTLESLMLLPVQRIYEYHKLLMRLYSLTPKDHPDYHDLRRAITSVGSMVQEREQQLTQSQNELKLEQVQERFPHDNLFLSLPLDSMEMRISVKRSRTYHYGGSSTGSTPIHRMKSPSHNWMSTPILGTNSPPQGIEETDMAGGSMPARNKVRLYLFEGPVRMFSHGAQSHDRQLFLFDDILIISKPLKQKSQQKHFRRKHQVRLAELWVTDKLDKSFDSVLLPHTFFEIGWPFASHVAAFGTPEEKNMWFNKLKKCSATQRQKAEQEKISIQVVNSTNSSSGVPTWMPVHCQEEARALLSRAIETMAIAVSEANCQLWVKISKDEAILLAGHEYPYAIQKYHNRHRLEYSDKPSQFQFIIKRKETSQLIVKQQSHKKSVISLPWRRPRSKPKSKNYRVFGAPLEHLICNNDLPELLQNLLVQLFTEGPTTRGIFRQSANHKKVKNLMESINNREHVKLYDCSIHEIGALLKNLLRNIPGGILLSSRYTEFVATNDFKDVQTRVQQIQKIVYKLPNENQLFLRYLMPLLHHISKAHEINGMNSINLAICFAPSLLWPSSGLDVIKNEVPPLIQFFIEHCPDIFGAELPVLYKQAALPPSPGVENMEFTLSTPTTQQLVPTKVDDGEYQNGHKQSTGVDSSSEGSTINESEKDHTSSLMRTRTSGLTLSDSQLSQISQFDDESSRTRHVRKRGVIEASGRHIHAENGIGAIDQSGVDRPSPKRVKKIRVPERSSSLRGPNDIPYNRPKYIKSRPPSDNFARRKSIATQELMQPRKSKYELPSPNSSSYSSTGYSPNMMRRIHESREYYPGYARHEDMTSHMMGKKKSRRVPQYSHSFTSKDMEKPSRQMPSSSSFHDDQHHSSGKYLTRLDFNSSDDQGHNQQASLFSTNSTQSIASSSTSSTTARPSNISLSSGGSLTGDLMMQNKVDRSEFLKVAISDRFNLSASGGGNVDYPQAAGIPPTTYPQDMGVIGTLPSREDFASHTGSESGQDSLERVQKKLHDRKRLESSDDSESAFSKSSTYRAFLNTQQKKDSLMSLGEESNIDDRPECDLHLGSLSRRRTLTAGLPDDPSRLYASNGYNSDTESAPSRTLNRPDKLKEVSSPTKYNMPSRYYMKPPQSEAGVRTLSAHNQQTYQYHQQKQQPQQSRIQQQQQQQQQQSVHSVQQKSSELSQSMEKTHALYGSGETPLVPVIAEPLVTRTVTKTTGSRRRPKSGDRVEKLTEVYKVREQEQMNANVEDAKVKLGLIPPHRQRSKSTSEKEAMKILHKLAEEGLEIKGSADQSVPVQEDEWTSKHREWLSSAPTSAERKKAWEAHSKPVGLQKERSNSLHTSGGVTSSSDSPGTKLKVLSYTPEARRKCATMPDNIINGKQIKTVKVRSYQIAEAQKIRRINLRTYYN